MPRSPIYSDPTGVHKAWYLDTPIKVIPQIGALDYSTLKNVPAPRGATGSLAILVDLAAYGTSQAPATPPTGALYVWVDSDLSPDNGTTIIRPANVADTVAGRWMRISAI